MTLSEMRVEARKSLAGKWGKAALLALVFSLIVGAISWILSLIPVVGSIAQFVIELPITYGFIVSMIKLKRGEEVGYVDFLTNGFKAFTKVWTIIGNTIIKMIIPIVLTVVCYILIGVGFGMLFAYSTASAGQALIIIGSIALIPVSIWATVKGLLYSLTLFLLYDNENMSGKDIVEESERLMKGNRVRFFFLPFTFLGWAILACLTLGIGSLWLTPYMAVTTVVFYESLAGNKSTTEKAVEAKVEEPTTEE